METYTLEITIDGKVIILKRPLIQEKLVEIDSFFPIMNEHLTSSSPKLTNAIEIDEFENDIRRLTPASIQGDKLKNSIDKLFETVQWHIKNYGRILPADLYTYINESILIIFLISEQILNKPLQNKNGFDFFKLFYSVIYKKLPESIRNQFFK